MDYKRINALLGEAPGLTDYDQMVANRRAKTQAELAGLDEMEALIGYTTPPQLMAEKQQQINSRREAIAADRQALETDEDFLRRYAESRLQSAHSPAPTAEREMEPYIAPSARDMIRQPQLSEQTFGTNRPVLPTDQFYPDYAAPDDIGAPVAELLRSIPRGAANTAASAPAVVGALQANSNREAAAYLEESERVLYELADRKRAGMDEIEFIQEASRMIDGAPQAIRQKVSQAIGAINAGDDPDTVIDKYRADMAELATRPMQTKDTPAFKMAESAHKAINETLPVRPGYEDSWSRKIGEGTGSLAPIIAGSLLLGPAGGIATGMATQGGAATEEAVRDKADEDDILKYGLAGTAIGATEALPVGKLLGTGSGIVGRSLGLLEKAAPETMAKVTQIASKLSPAGRSKLAQVAGQLVGQGIEEGTQEGLSQTLLNAAGKLTYDENRSLYEGVPESIALGAIIGGGVKGIQLAGEGALNYKDPVDTTASANPAAGDASRSSPGSTSPQPGGGGLGGLEGEILDKELTPRDPIAGTIGRDPFTIDAEANKMQPRQPDPAREMGLGGLEGEILNGEVSPREPVAGTLGQDPTIIEGSVNRAAIPETRKLPNPQRELEGSTEDYAVIDDGDDALEDLTEYSRKSFPSRPLQIEKREDLEVAAADAKEPTEAQKQAGNYRKGHIKVDGFDITVETPKGATRKGVDREGKEWTVEMPGHYGYIKRTTGMDGDNVDVTVGDELGSDKIYVIDQVDADTKSPDEHKVIMGTSSPEAARELYRKQFSDGRGDDRLGAMVEMDGATFKGWLKNGRTDKPIVSQVEPENIIQAPPQETAKTEDKPDINVMLQEVRAKREARGRQVDELTLSGKPIRFSKKDGQTALASADTAKPGAFRLTRFDDKGPIGHTEYNTMREAIDAGLQEGYQVEARKGQKNAIAKAQDGFGSKGSSYPTAPRSEWYSDGNYKEAGGEIVEMTPDQYLASVRPLKIDEESRENIDILKEHIQSGKTLDPLKIYDGGKEDGRHRAHAAKELGISKVPVVVFGDQRSKIVSIDGKRVYDDPKKGRTNEQAGKTETGTAGVQPGHGQPGSGGGVARPGDPGLEPAQSRVSETPPGAQGGKPGGSSARGARSHHPKAADARGRNRGRLPEPLRRFAEKEGDSEKLTLTHFGHKFHTTLKPSDGWRSRGSERDMAGHPDFVPRTYYGIGTGQEGGYRKEVTGKFGHKTSIDPADLYDAATDPDNLDTGKGLASYEKAIKDAGYAGYITKVGMKGEHGPAAVVFYEAEVEEHFDDGIEDPKDLPRAKGLEKSVKLGATNRRLFVGPVKRAREIKAAYAKKAGIKPATRIREYLKVDVERATRIANEFELMKHDPQDPLVKSAYDAMIKETLDQYQAMLDAGFKAEMMTPGMADPYPDTPRLAIEDIRENNHMWVFPTDDGFGSSDLDVSDNPLLQKTKFKDINGKVMLANDVFRAVHDYFGHAVEGNGMRPRGEEMAWRVHASMYSPLARRAMTTETRGQNSWVNFGPNAEHNRTASGADTIYAPQKIGLLPEWVSEEGLHDQTHLDNIAKMKVVQRGRKFGEPASVKQTRAPKPESLIEFLARKGGIQEQTGELKSIGLTDKKTGFVSGYGPLVRQNGNPPDRAREMAEQAGYLREGSTIADLYDALAQDARSGREVFSERDQDAAERWRDAEKGMADIPFFGDVYNLSPGFYSNITRGIEKAKQVKAPAKDWKAIIAALPGVRKAEIDWIDVNGWLDAQEGQVTKEDLVNYIKANEIEIHETILTPNGNSSYIDEPFTIEVDDDPEMVDPDQEYIEQVAKDYMDEERERLMDEADGEDVDEDDVRGAAIRRAEENYYESPEYQGSITITYADGSSEGFVYNGSSDAGYYWDGNNYNNLRDLNYAVRNYAEEQAASKEIDPAFIDTGSQYESYTEDGGSNYREILLSIPGLEEKGTNATHRIGQNGEVNQLLDKEPYISSHFDNTPNIIVHARTTDRQRGKVLFIEEVQSDLGSDIRKAEERNGAPPTEADFKRWEEIQENIAETQRQYDNANIILGNAFFDRYPDYSRDNKLVADFHEDLEKGFWTDLQDMADPAIEGFVQAPYGMKTRADTKEQKKALWPLVKWVYDNLKEETDDLDKAHTAKSDARLRRSEMQNPHDWQMTTLPAFPFEGESYYHLAMKRLLRMAVDEGKSAIAWTPAYMQGERWSQAVQNVVGEIRWGDSQLRYYGDGIPEGGRVVTMLGSNSGNIDHIVVDADGKMLDAVGGKIKRSDVRGKMFSELVGSNIAKQVMAEPEGTIEGERILIGGDGYKIAYDRHMKGFMEKFAKKYGSAVTVDNEIIQVGQDIKTRSGDIITDDKIKASAVEKAFVEHPSMNGINIKVAIDGRYNSMRQDIEKVLEREEEALQDFRKTLSVFNQLMANEFPDGNLSESMRNRKDLYEREIARTEDVVEKLKIRHEGIINRRGSLYEREMKKGILSVADSFTSIEGMKRILNTIKPAPERPVWRVEITPAMRDAILEGQPFSIGREDYRLTPDAQNKIDELLAVIRKVAPGIKVRMDMSIDGNKNIWGKYSRDNGAITIAAVALQAGRGKQVFGHEALHAFVDHGLLTKQEIAILQAYADKHDLIGKYGLREAYEKTYGARGLDPADYQRMINEEGIAELVGELIGNPKAEIPGELAGIIGKLKRLLERIANAIRGLGFQTTRDILEKITSGEVGGRKVEGFTPKDGELYRLGEDHVASIKRTTADDLGDFLATDNRILRRGRALQRYLQDKFLSVKLMQRALADQISDDENAYLAEELSAARIPEQTQEMNDKMQDILEDLHDADISRDLFERFLRMKHAEERNEHIAKINTKFPDGGSGTRTEAAKRWLKMARRITPPAKWAAMESAAQKVYAISRDSLRRRLEAGLIDQVYYNELVNQYRYYVPLKGHEFADDLKPISSNRGYGAKGKGIMQALGRRSEAQNTLSYVVEDYRRAIYSAERNKVNVALFNFLKNNQKLKADGTLAKNDFVELDPVRYKRILVKKRGLYQGRKIWIPADFVGDNAKIASYLAGLEGNASERLRLDPTMMHNDLPVMIDGKRHIMRIKNETLLNDLLDMHMNVERIPFFSAAMSGFTRMLTMWNPAFGPTNFVRDVMGVGLTTGSELGAKEAAKVMRDAFKMTRILLKAVRNQSSQDPDTQRLLDLYKKMKLSGGSTGFSHVVRDAETIQRELETQAEWLAGNRSTKQVLKHGLVAVDRFMEKFNRIFEDATRLAAYKNRLDAGDTDKQALSYAKNVTVNFNKRGHQAGFSQWYAFANANFQGNYRMLRAFINGKNGGKVLSGLFMGGFLYGLANILMGYDDDDPEKLNSWYERNQYDKAFYIILGPIKLPKPHGFMIPFDIGTKAAELMMAAIDPEHNNPQRRSLPDLTASAVAEVGAQLSSFVPIGTQEDTILRFFPTLTAPIASAALNMSPFGGSLYPEGFDKTTPNFKQFYAETPEIYHKAAQWMNTLSGGNDFQSGYVDISPEVLEFLVNSYAGGAGGELRKTSALAMAGLDAALGNETKPIRIEDIPIIRRFFPSQRTNSLTDYYYQFSDRMQEVKNAMSEAKEGSESARAFLKEHELERRLMGQWEATKKQRTAVRKKIDALDEERLAGGSVGARRDAYINKRSLIERRFARTYQIESQIADLQQREQTPAVRQAIAKLQRDRQVMQENVAKLMADQDQLIANRPTDSHRMSSLSTMFK